MEVTGSMSTCRQLKLTTGNPSREEAAKPLGIGREPSVHAAPVHQKLHGKQDMTLMEQLVSDAGFI